MTGSQPTLSYRIALPLAVVTACLPWVANAGQDAVPYPQSEPPRVAYIQKVDPGFEVRILDAATGTVHDLLHLINQPGHLSVARHGETLLVFGDSALHIVDAHGQGQEAITPLPQPATPKGNSTPEPIIAGYLEDGSLAIVMDTTSGASTDTFIRRRTLPKTPKRPIASASKPRSARRAPPRAKAAHRGEGRSRARAKGHGWPVSAAL